MFILYPQNGRVNAKAPKARQNFTLHQFEKVGWPPASRESQTSHELFLAQGHKQFGEMHKELQSPVIILCIGCRSTISEILLM